MEVKTGGTVALKGLDFLMATRDYLFVTHGLLAVIGDAPADGGADVASASLNESGETECT